MRFVSIATALFVAAGVIASPTPLHKDTVVERDNAELEPRLLGLIGGGCNDLIKINLCKLKGHGWGCNDRCECEYKPPVKECPHGAEDKCWKDGGSYDRGKCYCTPKPKPQCPEQKKWDCQAKGKRYSFNAEHCACYEVGCPKDEKDKCLHKQGTYNEHECYCTPKPQCPDSKKWECEAKGKRFSFDAKACHCEEVGCPKKDKEHCERSGKVFDDHECTCKAKQCKESDKADCAKWHGTFNKDTCSCTPPEHEPCKDWWKLLTCKKAGKGCNSQCQCY